jgi:hypothetical protein
MDAFTAPADAMAWIVTVLAGLTVLSLVALVVCALGAVVERLRSSGASSAQDAVDDAPVEATVAVAGVVSVFDVDALDTPPVDLADGFVAPDASERLPVPSFVRPLDDAPLFDEPQVDEPAIDRPAFDVPVFEPMAGEPSPVSADAEVTEPAAPGELPLPAGAEAALNAITELFADPRNVVVTHRDPTGEVRVTPLAENLTRLRRGA